MRIGFGVVLLLSVVALTIATSSSNDGVYDYHRKFGIPRGLKIKEHENAVLTERVAGGSGTTTLSVPYQAGLIMTILIWSSVCGGAIISDNTVLTAAHCYNDGNSIAQSITVVVGSNFLFTGGNRITDTTVFMHPGYNPWIVANDIAVVKVPQIVFSTFIQPINLPSGNQVNDNFVGTTALASGFGVTNDGHYKQLKMLPRNRNTENNIIHKICKLNVNDMTLQKLGDSIGILQGISSVNVQVISNDDCARTYPGIIQTHHLCTSGAGGLGICGRDTGGPLVATVNWRRILIGIGSFISNSGCQAGDPSGFSRVTYFLSWIYSV